MTPSQPGPTLDSYPTQRSCPFSPPDVFDRLRGQAELPTVEVLRGGRPWLITRYDDARAVLASGNFSARMDRSGFPLVTPTDLQQLDSERPSLVRTDDPEHLQKRRRLTRDFTVKRINALEPEIQHVIDECVDGLLHAGRPADLVAELALPVPSRVICLLLGVPYDQHEFFQRKSAEALSGQADVDTVRTALDELAEYLASWPSRSGALRRKTCSRAWCTSSTSRGSWIAPN
ncbi:cytochrome P450 [Saccharopolyspora karakumensis]|uniref:Cytochrome P450 n=1 Tax=Saccharopolyspora karakumensis TaxID=2530386 RepID=A0A4R5BVE3_9PSEU|nr:cytochrome P450 [Saccharopolyspora karakumensis]TDD90079.1 cytochrome P450 [Saccharopolyspora karakumensis]